MYELSVRSSFSGAHRLKGYHGKCEGLHGHNWSVEVCVGAKKLDRIGIALDFKSLKQKLSGVLAELDHRDLNKLAFFKKANPSAENIAKYVYVNLKKSLKTKGIKLNCVRVWETQDSCATYFE